MKKVFLLVLAVSFIYGCGQNDNSQSSNNAAPTTANETKQRALINAGLQDLKDSKIADAIKNFDSAIKEDPSNPQGYMVLGQTYMRMQEFDRAINTFSAATKVAPEQGELYYFLALSYGLKGDRDSAKVNAEKSMVLFKEKKDQNNFLKSAALLKGLMESDGNLKNLSPEAMNESVVR
jgi:predicted Zn-dependent protease